MTRIATMGTSSCATIAIAGFKDEHVKANKQFLEEGKVDVTQHGLPGGGKTVAEFYKKVLYPTDQPLGHTKEYAFDELMKEIDSHKKMADKFTIATINSYQYNKGYWPERFNEWGFELMDATKNNMGQVCYLYVRNRARMALPEAPDASIDPFAA